MTEHSALFPHRRYNPLTGEWLLVSPHRATRPWLGAVEKMPQENLPEYDPKCYLCPGNTRVNGEVNLQYPGVYIFENDFPALIPHPAHEHGKGSAASTEHGHPATGEPAHVPEPDSAESAEPQVTLVTAPQQHAPSNTHATHPHHPHSPLMVSSSEAGICRVICFSPRHDLTLAQLPHAQIRAVVDMWVMQCEELGNRPDIDYVQLFENRGDVMGASNPHPHGQIWANEHVPTEPAKEQHHQLAYLQMHDQPLLIDYLADELQEGERIVFENDHFVTLVPFWAVWPFELMVLPKAHVRQMVDLSLAQRDALADALKRIATRYDNMFETPFPYSMGVHQAPYDGEKHEEWQMHLHFYPPLLRSATVKKFMVGYEMLAQPQRDLTAEQSAERLRALSEVRYA